jgi:O-antigen ligase
MSEMGYVGLAIWVVLVLTTIAYGFKVIYNTTNLKVKLTAYIALLSLMTYYTHAILNNYSQYDKVAVPLWAFTAIIAALDLYHKNGINHVKKTI